MLSPRTILICASTCAFAVGLFFSLAGEKQDTASPKTAGTSKYRFGSPESKGEKQAVDPAQRDSASAYSSFSKRVQNTRTSEELERLFDEQLTFSDEAFALKMNLLLEKWGEIAPKQALEKIKSAQDSSFWMSSVFQGWAQKNPEAAAHFYKESQEHKIKNNFLILSAICQKWANHDPQKAWEWLNAQKEFQRAAGFQFAQRALFDNLASNSPQKALQLFQNLKSTDKDKFAYILGEKCAPLLAESPEWRNQLPENALIKAEAGKIMTLSNGDFNSIKTQLAALDPNQKEKIITELAAPLLLTGLPDIPDRVHWLMESLPDPLSRYEVRSAVNDWFLEDPIEASQWLDSLPAGKNKDKLLKIYQNKQNPMAIMNYKK